MGNLTKESIILAKTCLNNKIGAELIAKLCNISFENAKELVKNYENANNKKGYIITVAALLQQQNENNIENKFKPKPLENDAIQPEFMFDARIYLNLGEGGAVFIAELCNISYDEALAIVENYKRNNNKKFYITKVAAMLQQQAESKELGR